MQNSKWRLFLLGLLPVIYLAVLLAPAVNPPITDILPSCHQALLHPFHLTFTANTAKILFLFLFLYCALWSFASAQQPQNRRGAEHGSAVWGSAGEIMQHCGARPFISGKILTQNVSLSMDTRKHGRNLNVLVCGGSGSGKTRYYVKPNILNCCIEKSSSVILLDPKGELSKSSGGFLLKNCGYSVKILNLIDMEHSWRYNPFVYLTDDNSVQKLITNLFENTTPNHSTSSDPFWDQAAQMLLLALVFYLHYYAPPEEQNFAMVMEMIRAGEVKEENESYRSALDLLFDELALREPDSIALKYYRSYRSGSSKTLKSIQITLLSRLEKFNLPSLARLTECDELDLRSMGEKKTALFAVIPDNDTSFNFIIGMLYTQLFQELYYSADHIHQGALPVHVHFLMDEFANVAIPSSFDKLLATMRSREISVSIIVQNMAQLKKLFEKEWESVVGNCDSFLYLGGNEQATHEYVSKLLGESTLSYTTSNESKGAHGSHTVVHSITGRKLLDPSEVRLLHRNQAILFIRGEKPLLDNKYNLLRHPAVSMSADGGAPLYDDASFSYEGSTIYFETPQTHKQEPHSSTYPGNQEYELYSAEEIAQRIHIKGELNNETSTKQPS